jgi:hypothetical protein
MHVMTSISPGHRLLDLDPSPLSIRSYARYDGVAAGRSRVSRLRPCVGPESK